MGGWDRLGSDDDFQIRQVLLVRVRFCSLGLIFHILKYVH